MMGIVDMRVLVLMLMIVVERRLLRRQRRRRVVWMMRKTAVGLHVGIVVGRIDDRLVKKSAIVVSSKSVWRRFDFVLVAKLVVVVGREL